MNVASTIRREVRFPHAVGSALALALVAALVPRDGAPILIAFYIAAAALAVAVAFRRIPRFRLLPIVSLLAFAFGGTGTRPTGSASPRSHRSSSVSSCSAGTLGFAARARERCGPAGEVPITRTGRRADGDL